jgi:hypothetical protein
LSNYNAFHRSIHGNKERVKALNRQSKQTFKREEKKKESGKSEESGRRTAMTNSRQAEKRTIDFRNAFLVSLEFDSLTQIHKYHQIPAFNSKRMNQRIQKYTRNSEMTKMKILASNS